MSIRRRIFPLFVSSLLAVLPAPASEESQPPSARPLDSLAKSLLIPGWGQISENHFIEGLFFLSAEMFCIYQFVRWDRKGNTAYRSYQEALNVEDAVRFRRLTEQFDTRRNRFLLAGVLIWAANLIDMSIIMHNRKKEETLSLQIEEAGPHGVSFTVSICF